ncbi:MAG: hypothetical protein J4G05_08685 [Chlorobi bacterium]|nr:hypothetical protein [Chlorobiota bacterium]
MGVLLTEKHKALLSAYLDGELTGSEYAEAERLLERSAEARTWLQDASSVGKLSITAAGQSEVSTTSTKLTGTAIASMAEQRGGGSLFQNAIRSPWGGAGTVGALIVGAVLVTQPFSRSDDSPPIESQPIAEVMHEPAYSVRPTTFVPDNSALIVPPISSRDLVGFALDGILPINQERTSFIVFAEKDGSDERTIKEVDAQLRSLEPQRLLALDSLSGLLRTAVLRKDARSYAVRHDLADLRENVVTQMDALSLSFSAREQLLKARQECELTQQRVGSRLDAEMDRMRSELMVGSQQQYILINAKALTEGPPGDRRQVVVFERIGSFPDFVVVNPDGVSVVRKNPKLVSLIASSRRKAPSVVHKNRAGLSVPSHNEESYDNQIWEDEAAKLFMANVIITFTSKHGQIIISNDADTTFTSPLIDVEEESEAFYDFGSVLLELTDSLNALVGRIAVDRTKSAEERAEQIYRMHNQYRRQVEEMLKSMRQQQETDAKEVYQEKVDDGLIDLDTKSTSEEATQSRPTCSPLENDPGVS